MKSFKEIYNKRRTKRTDVQIENGVEVYYVENAEGEYVFAPGIGYISKDNPYHYMLRTNSYNNTINYNKEHELLVDTNIVGTALAFTCTLWEYVITNNKLWNWFVGVVTDGYFMIFFSPFILAYWALLIVAYIPTIIILSALVVGAVVWTPIIEFPAGYINKEKNQYIESWLS